MTKSVFIIAGEVSGDVLGGRLIKAFKYKRPELIIHGIGGHEMTGQGLKSLFPMEELSVMGLAEILPRLPSLIKRIRQTAAEIVRLQPDIVVTIDSPDFVKRVVKKARPHCPQTRFIHYVAPTVWAWREGRAKTLAKLYDGLICLLPFEPSYFEKYGLRAEFCGHPLIETIPEITKQRDPGHILILPGSRLGEVSRLAPVFAETLQKLQEDSTGLKASVIALPSVKDVIQENFRDLNVNYIEPDKRFEAFQNAGRALVASGTAGLELAVAGCPHVIAYKMNPLTYWLARRMIRVQYAHLANIMAGRDVIPEFLQNECTADNLYDAVRDLETPGFKHIRRKLAGNDPSKPPSEQAADFVLSFL